MIWEGLQRYCSLCPGNIIKGDAVVLVGSTGVAHVECAKKGQHEY